MYPAYTRLDYLVTLGAKPTSPLAPVFRPEAPKLNFRSPPPGCRRISLPLAARFVTHLSEQEAAAKYAGTWCHQSQLDRPSGFSDSNVVSVS